MKAVKPELTPEEMLLDMGLHARSSVVHVEPTTVAEWRECIGHVLCAAAFDAGLAEALVDAARTRCREIMALDDAPGTTNEARTMLSLLAGGPR